MFLGLFEEAGQAVEYTVIGDRQGLHSKLRRPCAELVRARTAVQQTVVGMDMQMNKLLVFFTHGGGIIGNGFSSVKGKSKKLFTSSLDIGKTKFK